MPDSEAIKTFLVELGYKVQSESEQKFTASIEKATNDALKFGEVLEGVLLSAGKIAAGVAAAGAAILAFAEAHNAAMRQMELGAAFAGTTIQHMEDEAYALVQAAGLTKEAGRSLVESYGAWAQSMPNEVGFVGATLGIKDYHQTDTALQLKDIGKWLAQQAAQHGMWYAVSMGAIFHLSQSQVMALIAQANGPVDFTAQGQQINQNFGIDMKRDADSAHEFMQVWNKLTEDYTREENHFVAMLDRAGLTKHLQDLSAWVDSHGTEISATLQEIAKDLMAAGDAIFAWGKGVSDFWNSLTPGEKEWTEELGKLLLAVLAFRKAPFLFGLIAIGELIGDFQGLKDGTVSWTKALTDLTAVGFAAWASGALKSIDPLNSKLLLILATLNAIQKATQPMKPEDWSPDSPLWRGFPESEQLKYPNSPASRAKAGTAGDNPNPYDPYNPGSRDWLSHMWENFKNALPDMGAGDTAPSGVPPTGPMFGAQIHQEAYRTYMPQQQQRGTPGDTHVADMLMQYFESKGWTHAQASGIVGNLQAESALNPNAVNPTGHIGLAQWDQHRQELYAHLFGHRMDDPRLSHMQALAEQAMFIQWELTHTEAIAGQLLGASSNFAQAADAFNRGYERSDTPSGQRAGFAGEDYNRGDTNRYNAPQPPPAVHVHVQVQQAAATKTTTGAAPITQNISNVIHTTGDAAMIGNAVFNATSRANASLVRYARGAVV